MKNLILIKLGGSLITDKGKPFTVRKSVIKRLSQEIHGIRRDYYDLVIGHGGGSFPHYPAKKYETHKGVINKKSIRGIAEVQDAASKLNRIVVGTLIKAGVNAISFTPSSFLVADNGKVNQAFIKPIISSLGLGMLPVVYGDVVFDGKMGCSILSTEKLLNFLALKLKDNYKTVKIIYCGITNGVYDKNGDSIKKISSKNYNKIESGLGASSGIDVTGGMLHKVQEALFVTNKGISTLIINGNNFHGLQNAIRGKNVKGTLITE